MAKAYQMKSENEVPEPDPEEGDQIPFGGPEEISPEEVGLENSESGQAILTNQGTSQRVPMPSNPDIVKKCSLCGRYSDSDAYLTDHPGEKNAPRRDLCDCEKSIGLGAKWYNRYKELVPSGEAETEWGKEYFDVDSLSDIKRGELRMLEKQKQMGHSTS